MAIENGTNIYIEGLRDLYKICFALRLSRVCTYKRKVLNSLINKDIFPNSYFLDYSDADIQLHRQSVVLFNYYSEKIHLIKRFIDLCEEMELLNKEKVICKGVQYVHKVLKRIELIAQDFDVFSILQAATPSTPFSFSRNIFDTYSDILTYIDKLKELVNNSKILKNSL